MSTPATPTGPPALSLETDIAIDHVNRLGWTALLEAIILGGGDRPRADSSTCSSTPVTTSTSPTPKA